MSEVSHKLSFIKMNCPKTHEELFELLRNDKEILKIF